MNIILGFLTILITLILTLSMLILFVPISYSLSIGYNQKLFFNSGIQGGKLYGFDITHTEGSTNFRPSFIGLSFNFFNKKKEKNKNNPPTVKEIKRKPSPRFGDLLDNSDFFKAALHTGIEIINIIKPKKLAINGIFGLGDPYNTGLILGVLAVLNSINKSFIIDVTPLWDEEYFEGEMYLAGRLVLVIILVKIIRFLLSRTTINYWRSLRKRSELEKSCDLSS